ncbi:TPA: U-box domain-containing protein [Legionella anisa]
MPQLKELFENLKQDPIMYVPMKNPVLASDLRFYNQDTYKSFLEKRQNSPFTREPFLENPFPLNYKKFSILCSSPSSIKSLVPLAICPITHEIMKNPQKALITYSDLEGDTHSFITICDLEALKTLPQSFKLVKKVDWEDLKLIINAPEVKPKLQEALQEKAFSLKELGFAEYNSKSLVWEAEVERSRLELTSNVVQENARENRLTEREREVAARERRLAEQQRQRDLAQRQSRPRDHQPTGWSSFFGLYTNDDNTEQRESQSRNTGGN